jgi:hypothetical protein
MAERAGFIVMKRPAIRAAQRSGGDSSGDWEPSPAQSGFEWSWNTIFRVGRFP